MSFYNKSKLSIIAITLSCYSVIALGDGGWNFMPGFLKPADPNSQFHARYPASFQDDITSDQNFGKLVLSPAQQHQALAWGLNSDQEKRYLFLMQNKMGTYAQNAKLTPVEVLGINARDDQERQYYAQLDSQQEAQYIAKSLAFYSVQQQSYSSLMNQYRLPVLRSFDVSKYSPYNYQPLQLQGNDKVMLFVNLNSSVKPIMSVVMDQIIKTPGTQFNIYLIGNDVNNSSITQWAKSQNIPPYLVSNQSITLNFGDRLYSTLAGHPRLPVLYLLRNGQNIQINTEGF